MATRLDTVDFLAWVDRRAFDVRHFGLISDRKNHEAVRVKDLYADKLRV